MGFIKKIWQARVSEYPTRRTLTKEDGTTELVTVARNEGQISKEGDAFSPDNMNDLEERIGAAFEETNNNLISINKQFGNITLTNIYANNQSYYDVTFDKPYKNTPFIEVTSTNKVILAVANVTANGFRIWGYNVTASDIPNCTVLWKAEEQT